MSNIKEDNEPKYNCYGEEYDESNDEYWWGTFTSELAKEGWIDQGKYPPYKKLGDNGRWMQVKFYHDGAIYSYCKCCGFIHDSYKTIKDIPWKSEYDPINEYKYCPECGKNMHIRKRFNK